MSDAVIILQARLASRRLPGKALASIGARSMLGHCIARLRISGAAPVMLATTENAEDDALAAVAECYGIKVFRGAEDDVLSRFLLAAQSVGARHVVRATADNPAIDIGGPARVLRELVASQADHVIEDGLPYGAAVEAVTVDALARAAARATSAHDREHVTPMIRRDRAHFVSVMIPAPANVWRPDTRLTVDTADDLRFMGRLAACLDGWRHEPELPDILALIDRQTPALRCA